MVRDEVNATDSHNHGNTSQSDDLGPIFNGEETSFDRVRGKAPYKWRKVLNNIRNNPVKSGDNSASACSHPVNQVSATSSTKFYSREGATQLFEFSRSFG